MITLTRFVARPYAGDADLPAVCDLLNLCNEVDQLRDEPYATVDETRRWFTSPELDPAHDIRLWTDGERVLALGITRIAPPDPTENEQVVDAHLYFRTHPDAR